MATTQEAIARLRMIFETQGADAAVAEMKKLESAETSLGASSLNLDRAFTNLERRYSETARATADYERAMKTLNAAVAQNPALAERGAAIMATVTARYEAQIATIRKAAEAQTAFGQVTQVAQTQAQSLAGSTGLLGGMLSTLGRGGTLAAVGIGAAYLAFEKLDQGVAAFAQRARAISEFAETTGLTTTAVQGLNKEAARFGIDSEKMQTGLQRFVSQMDEFRQGGGQLLDVVRSIDAGLAEQMQQTDDTGEQLKLLQKAIEGTTNAFQKARLERAAFGRGGLALGQIDFAAGMQRTGGIPEETIQEMKRLQGEIDATSTNIGNKIYAEFGVAWERSKLQMLLYFEALIKGKALINVDTSKKALTPDEENAAKLQDLTAQAQRLQEQIDRINNSTLAGTEYWDNFYGAANKGAELQVQALEKVKAEIDALKAKTAAAAESPEVKSKLQTAQIADLLKLQQVLGSLMPVEQQVELATKQLNQAMETASPKYREQIEAAKNALIDLKTVQAEMSQVDPGTYRRQLEAIDSIKAAYPGLVAQDAIRLAQLADQLRVAQAMPGAARMAAEEQARINQLLLEGKDLMLAITIAAKERAVAQAQINSAADQQLAQLRDEYGVASAVTGLQKMEAQAQATYNQLVRQGVSEKKAQAIAEQQLANAIAQVNAGAQQQLLNLQNQHGVAAAVTGEEKIRAQEIATINSLLQQGVSLENATAVAAQERANAEAQVNAQIQQQVYKLNEATDLINAKMADGLSKIIGINEINVRTQQAFNDAIRQGASYADALALKYATLNNLLAQQNMQIMQQEQQAYQQNMQIMQQEQQAYQQQEAERDKPIVGTPGIRMYGTEALIQALDESAKAGSALAKAFLAAGPYTPSQITRMRDLPQIVAIAQEEARVAPAQQQAQQQLASLQNQYRLGAAATPQEKAQIQAQITYEDLIRQGVQSNLAHQIANQELANAMQELTNSVDANTAALQDQLDPIYTEGRASLRIGYYGEGAGGTMRTVTGTGFAGAANENAQPSGNLIVINNNFPAGAVMGDRRTQLQAANAYGRAVAATGT